MRFLLLLPLLAACGMPHPLGGLGRTGEAQALGHSYRVNWNAETAQVTRTNRVWRPDYPRVAQGAMIAAELVTGCMVEPATVEGDVALVNMNLDCTGAGAT